MLTYPEIALHMFVAALTPLIVLALAGGLRTPENIWLFKYHYVEKGLYPCGNLLMLMTCAQSFVRLGLHFGMIEEAAAARFAPYPAALFLLLLSAYIALWIRAAVKLHKAENSAPSI